MNGRFVRWMAFGCLTVGCGLAVAQQQSTERPGSRVEASPAGLLMRLPAGKADADGLVMAPATESIMGSLPPAKAGVGSAVNDTTREVGGALGVAASD